MIKPIAPLAIFVVIIFSPLVSFCQESPSKGDCLTCHDNINIEEYNESSHGSNPCTSCHTDIQEIPHTENPAKVDCLNCHKDEALIYSESIHGQMVKAGIPAAKCPDCHGSHDLLSPTNPKSKIYWSKVPSICGQCHEDILKTYLGSIHGKAMIAGKRDAPVCTSCHGEHNIKSHDDPKSSVYPTAIAKKTCGQCHAAERIVTKYRLPSGRLETYLQSYHGLAGKFGVTTVANCASCHGVHNILPASDPDSDVNKKNLPKTCGKCHPNVGDKLAKGSVHLAPSMKQDQAVFYVTCIYIILIILTIGGMLIHNALDFISVFKVYYREHREKAVYIRFTPGERIQHFILMISFLLLAYTGFALRYRDAWWAAPFTVWSPGFDWRGIVHKGAAFVFIALVILHVYYLFCTTRGKEQLKSLMIKRKDFSDFFETITYYFGIRKQKPIYARFSYIEKVEYWALVWGCVIMIATGTILMFENFFLRYFSKWIFDVARTIHYFEALLAVLAIVIWHLYFNVFHPEHYPINLSMLTGKVPEEEHREDGDKDEGRPKKDSNY